VQRFILTKELGRLSRWLRILGFDSRYFSGDNTGSLVIEALRDNRTILTRNHRLPQLRGARILLIKAERLNEQLIEVVGALGLKPDPDKMFSRCLLCNVELAAVDKEKIKDKIPEYVFQTQDYFVSCPECKRIYWTGTHWGNVQKTLKRIGL
jgi:uncharacterized protein with PIN domain